MHMLYCMSHDCFILTYTRTLRGFPDGPQSNNWSEENVAKNNTKQPTEEERERGETSRVDSKAYI